LFLQQQAPVALTTFFERGKHRQQQAKARVEIAKPF
jgi:hypothetical protein